MRFWDASDKISVRIGDCLEVLPTLPDDSIDSCLTDPPYHLVSIVKRFGNNGSAPAQFGTDGRFSRTSAGFMGKQWDGGNIAQSVELWREINRVLKPGAHLLAFGGTRTYHRMACAIEDAGFEIRDCIQWLYGSGFPKSHDVSKGIDRGLGIDRQTIGQKKWNNSANHFVPGLDHTKRVHLDETVPATLFADQWEGWGTALKPACEPIVLARKPLSEKTVAANVLKWGTGAINVDGCRIETDELANKIYNNSGGNLSWGGTYGKGMVKGNSLGRWPANVIHDGSEEVVAGFPESGGQMGATTGNEPSRALFGNAVSTVASIPRGDTGSAARFFYTAKADSDDRIGSKHPTVKPLDLVQYLVRLVTPKGGTTLDPFAGTGTTGEAAFREGMKAVLIEREAEYLKDIERRISLCMAGPIERANAGIKARQDGKPRDDGPLFGGTSEWDEMWSRPFDRPELVWGKEGE